MLQYDSIIHGHNVDVLATFPDACIDLTVTSPPYDNLRTYKGFTFDFEGIARQLYRVTKEGGVVVWVVADATINGSETGTSFRQALRFMEIGFKLHDTMIYAKGNPIPLSHNRYEQQFEYMFILSKGKPYTFNPIKIPCKDAGRSVNYGKMTESSLQGGAIRRRAETSISVSESKTANNIWFYGIGGMDDIDISKHPGTFPEKLAADHVLSWSNPGDVVLDPFCGSGTTCKMAAVHHRRYIGIDVAAEYVELSQRRVATIQPKLELEMV